MYGNKPDRTGCDLPLSNEDWQFEKPLLKVSIEKGKVIADRSIREVGKVEFRDLPMEKQIAEVAEAYNAGKTVSEMKHKFGLTDGPLYNRINKAKEAGLITKMRDGKPTQAKDHPWKQQPAVLPKSEDKPEVSVTIEDFEKAAEVLDNKKQELADKLAQITDESERMARIRRIAQAIYEELGDGACDVLGVLYEKVSA